MSRKLDKNQNRIREIERQLKEGYDRLIDSLPVLRDFKSPLMYNPVLHNTRDLYYNPSKHWTSRAANEC